MLYLLSIDVLHVHFFLPVGNKEQGNNEIVDFVYINCLFYSFVISGVVFLNRIVIILYACHEHFL